MYVFSSHYMWLTFQHYSLFSTVKGREGIFKQDLHFLKYVENVVFGRVGQTDEIS